MKPRFSTMQQNYPATESQEALYTEIGWTDLLGKDAYKDTCAVRMSYALRLSDVQFMGASMRAKAGKIKGQTIQIRQGDLSQALKALWGEPEIYKGGKAAQTGIGKRKGVVSFFKIEGGSGGHIDLVEPGSNGNLQCERSCYFSAVTVWFWELP
jgi:hypothetical protein